MAELTTDERNGLHAAMMLAFPDRADLDQLLQLNLGENPASIAPEGSAQPTAMLKAITWFEARGRITDLVAAAHQARPGSGALTTITQAIWTRLRGADPMPSPSSLPGANSPGSGASGKSPDPPPPPDPQPNPSPNPADYAKALLAIASLMIAAVLALVFTRNLISAAQWTILKTVLAIASAILAMFIPGALRVAIGNWLQATGALGVFAIVFFLTPPPAPDPLMTVSGFIRYIGTTDPVQGAIVVYPPNNLKSSPTPADGYFTLNGVPTGTTGLRVDAGGKSYDIEIKTAAGGYYDVVTRELRPVDGALVSVSALGWMPIRATACTGNQPRKVAAFALTTPASSNAFGPTLLFRVVSTDEHLTIAQVLELKPDSAASVATADPSRQRQWEVSPVPTEGVTLRVALCLARDDGQRPDARRSLRTDYHYRRME